jgi:hypothetical protein
LDLTSLDSLEGGGERQKHGKGHTGAGSEEMPAGERGEFHV